MSTRFARIFLKGSNNWLDMPLADGQGMADIQATLNVEGCLVTPAWMVRADAWAWIIIMDVGMLPATASGQKGGYVVPFNTIHGGKPTPPAS